MISIFTVPKSFVSDDDSDNQEMAFQSWAALRPRPEIILLGDETYVDHQAAYFGFKHAPVIDVNEFGTPLLPSVFAAGEAAASNDLVMYINADIILPPDFMITVARLLSYEKPFAVGCRWDLQESITDADIEQHGWEQRLLEKSKRHAPSGIDYFIYRRGTLGEIPPFALGRWVWDNWLMWNAHQRGLQTVDLSAALQVFHPQHGYTHVKGGFQAGPEWQANRALGVGKMANIDSAAQKLEPFRVSIFGLGKLGAPMLACFASEGIHVYGIDPDYQAYRRVTEPGLSDLLNKHAFNYHTGPLDPHWAESAGCSTHASHAVDNSDATFVIVPTPSNPDGAFVLSAVLDVCKHVGQALRGKSEYHLVIITSTIMPRDMELIAATLEVESGKRCGAEFGLCYSPEFIALGSVIHDWLNPDYVLIGESDRRAGDMLEAIYATVCHNDPPAVRTSWVNAEIAKIAQNAAIVAKIELTNQLARLCHAVPGANVDEVTRALGHDSRIGPKYLKGGLAPGGPCFPRDCRALVRSAAEHGEKLDLLKVVQAAIHHDHNWLLKIIFEQIQDMETVIGFVGLAYKPGTPVTEESATLYVARWLKGDGNPVRVYDPIASAEGTGLEADFTSSLSTLCDESDVIVLMSPDQDLALEVAHWVFKTDKLVIDPWRHLLHEEHQYNYLPIGAHLPKE